MPLKKVIHLFQASIAKTMLTAFLLVIIPTLTLGLLSNVLGIHVASDEISNSYANAITLLCQQMSDRLYHMDMLAGSILLDHDLVEIANSSAANVDLFDYVLFQRKLLLHKTPQLLESNLLVFLPRQRWVISTETGILRMERIQNTPDLTTVQMKDTIWSIRPSMVSSSADCLSVLRGYVHENQSSPFMLMEVSRAEMEKALRTMSNNTQVLHTFFFDPLGNYFSTGSDLEPALMEQIQSVFSAESSDPNTQHILQYQGGRYRLLYETVGSYRCTIGMLFDESELFRPVVNIRIFFVVFVLFAVVASLSFILLSYRRIFSPVRSLTDAMLEVESGNLSARVSMEHENEFSVMSRQFNKMVAQLDHLIQESYVKELKLKNAQLRYLRSQINPHFLYNSLFSLYSMIQNGDLESASEMAVYLGKSYQRSAHFHEKELTIAEEIENINIYVRIMSIRFPQRLRLVPCLEEETLGLKIPVLSLQTVVENAVLHGMEGSSKECVVTLIARMEDGDLHLCVRDTGNGIPPEQLTKIRERLSHAMETDDKHGLENVYMRMKLMYGEGVSMTVSGNVPTGTQVEIRIPLKEDEDDV